MFGYQIKQKPSQKWRKKLYSRKTKRILIDIPKQNDGVFARKALFVTQVKPSFSGHQ